MWATPLPKPSSPPAPKTHEGIWNQNSSNIPALRLGAEALQEPESRIKPFPLALACGRREEGSTESTNPT